MYVNVYLVFIDILLLSFELIQFSHRLLEQQIVQSPFQSVLGVTIPLQEYVGTYAAWNADKEMCSAIPTNQKPFIASV